jgi:3-deoxy-D-manno-octulosonic-acid transferase
MAAIPMALINARLSDKSLRKAQRHPRLIKAAAASLGVVGAQTNADAERLKQFFRGTIEVTGNLKFDVMPDESLQLAGRHWRARWHERFGPSTGPRPVWLFASTREGEETIIIEAWKVWCRQVMVPLQLPRPILLFVPRHPERFNDVAKQLENEGTCLRRSTWATELEQLAAVSDGPDARRRKTIGAGPDFLLGDSMGEMPMYYAMADVALIGGSLLPLGGQNLIEACACGCPVVCGPHMFNFQQAVTDALAAGAATGVRDVHEALQAMSYISRHVENQMHMGQLAREFAASHRGATERTVALIGRLLPEGGQSHAAVQADDLSARAAG